MTVGAWIRKQIFRAVARVMEWTTRFTGRRLNLSEVTDQLLVGGAVPLSAYPRLASLGVTFVIDLRAEGCDDARSLERLGIELLHLPAPDRHGVPVDSLARGVEWALPRLAAGGRGFCHCEHGVGRGPSMALAILVAQGWETTAAYDVLRRARWQAVLNDRQRQTVAQFVQHWSRVSRMSAAG